MSEIHPDAAGAADEIQNDPPDSQLDLMGQAIQDSAHPHLQVVDMQLDNEDAVERGQIDNMKELLNTEELQETIETDGQAPTPSAEQEAPQEQNAQEGDPSDFIVIDLEGGGEQAIPLEDAISRYGEYENLTAQNADYKGRLEVTEGLLKDLQEGDFYKEMEKVVGHMRDFLQENGALPQEPPLSLLSDPNDADAVARYHAERARWDAYKERQDRAQSLMNDYEGATERVHQRHGPKAQETTYHFLVSTWPDAKTAIESQDADALRAIGKFIEDRGYDVDKLLDSGDRPTISLLSELWKTTKALSAVGGGRKGRAKGQTPRIVRRPGSEAAQGRRQTQARRAPQLSQRQRQAYLEGRNTQGYETSIGHALLNAADAFADD